MWWEALEGDIKTFLSPQTGSCPLALGQDGGLLGNGGGLGMSCIHQPELVSFLG